jgi:hypothetical protein
MSLSPPRSAAAGDSGAAGSPDGQFRVALDCRAELAGVIGSGQPGYEVQCHVDACQDGSGRDDVAVIGEPVEGVAPAPP